MLVTPSGLGCQASAAGTFIIRQYGMVIMSGYSRPELLRTRKELHFDDHFGHLFPWIISRSSEPTLICQHHFMQQFGPLLSSPSSVAIALAKPQSSPVPPSLPCIMQLTAPLFPSGIFQTMLSQLAFASLGQRQRNRMVPLLSSPPRQMISVQSRRFATTSM